MTDPMDCVRAFYDVLNRADANRLAECYHPDCIVEHVFTGDDGVYEGRDVVLGKWSDEFNRYEGARAGGHRIEVSRSAGIETGWGWVRADWQSAVRRVADGSEIRLAGHSHFWIEDGQIRRHRTVRTPGLAGLPGLSGQSGRHYPTRPIVGVGAVIVAEDGRIVLVKRRYEPLAGQWSLPGGSLELGETLQAGTAREVLEETVSPTRSTTSSGRRRDYWLLVIVCWLLA